MELIPDKTLKVYSSWALGEKSISGVLNKHSNKLTPNEMSLNPLISASLCPQRCLYDNKDKEPQLDNV